MSAHTTTLHGVVVDPVAGIDSVTVSIWLTRGSRDEAPDEHGASHLVEHLLATGSDPEGALGRVVEQTGGRTKALTTPEYILLSFTVPASHWEEGWTALERLVTATPPSDADIERERALVLNEIADAQDDPRRMMHELALQDLVGSHPLGRLPLGDAAVVRAMSPESVSSYFDRSRVAKDLVIVASGVVDEALIERANSLGQRLPSGSARSPRVPPEARSELTVHERDVSRPCVLLSWLLPLERADEIYTISILNRIVSSPFGPLHDALATLGASYSAYAYRSVFSDCVVWTIQAVCSAGDERAVLEAVRRALTNTLLLVNEDRLIAQTGAALAGSLAIGLEATHMRANWIGRNFLASGWVPQVSRTTRALQHVQPAAVDGLLRQVLATEPSVTIVTGSTCRI